LGSSCSSIAAIPQMTTGGTSPDCEDNMDLSGSWTTDNRWGDEVDYGSSRRLRKVSPPSPPLSPVRRRFKSRAAGFPTY
jgi:hypothetical protein